MVHLADPAERVLAIELTGFAAIGSAAEQNPHFHQLAAYLHQVATTLQWLLRALPSAARRPAGRDSQLVLCDLTAQVLRQGLHLGGIRTPERM